MSSQEQPRDFEIDLAIDCSGKRCPVPIYMATKKLKTMDSGQVLEVKCTDASSVNDFPAFVEKAGHNLLATERQDKTHTFFVRKG